MIAAHRFIVSDFSKADARNGNQSFSSAATIAQ
jgi:hypothetical protein